MLRFLHRRGVALAVALLIAYSFWINNGIKFGFSLQWLAMGILGFPMLLWAIDLYVRTGGQRAQFTPKQTVVLVGLLSLFLFLGFFESVGWYGLLFPLVFFPAALLQAARRTKRGADRPR